jgi:benzodiazapine receptor
MPFQLPSLLYSIPRSLPLAVGLPVLLGSLNGKITADAVKTWCALSLSHARSRMSAGLVFVQRLIRVPHPAETDPTLKQPSPGPPPGWVFPVVWTSLYAGMGWAAHVAVRALDTSPRIAVRHAASLSLGLWYGQFALNMAWTPLFFGARRTKTALVDIVALWGTVAALTVGPVFSNTPTEESAS